MFGRSRKSIEFLMDWQIADSLLRIIVDARRQLTLVSPYNKHWGHLKRELEAAQNRGVNIIMYYRSDEANPVADYNGIDGIPVRMLHSKIYSNEKTTLLTTMNLLETSAAYSREVGLLIHDDHLRREIDSYIKILAGGISASNDVARPGAGPERRNTATRQPTQPRTSKEATRIANYINSNGFCIECGAPKALEAERPLCPACFSKFGRAGTHQYCHKCGNLETTQVAQPFCTTCSDARLSAGAPLPATN